MDTPAYARAAAIIDPGPGDQVLEIGFGTGALLAMLAPRMTGGFLAGIDASELMVQQARTRLAHFAAALQLDIRQGTDQELGWPDGHFTCVAALHSFQFWAYPDRTLQRTRTLLRPGGQLLLVLRSRSRQRSGWLPNPISRSADEIGGTMAALERAGLARIERLAKVGSSAVLAAHH